MTAPSSTSAPEMLPAPARAALPYIILSLIVFAVYGNIYDNAFLFDDPLLITMNSYLTDWTHIGDILTGSTTSGAHIAGGFYRPVQILLYLVVYHLGHGSSFGFHLLNLGLHILNSCLVYKLGRKMDFAPVPVFLASLLWSVHPLHTEAVTYMSATADPLFAAFSLGAIIVLLPDFTTRKILMALPLFVLGLASKETTAMFPLMASVCLFFVLPRKFELRPYLRLWPFWLVSLGFVLWRMQAAGFDGPQTYARYYALPSYANLKAYSEEPLTRLYTFLATLPNYAQLLLWPEGLHMERSFPVYQTPWLTPVITGFAMVAGALAHIVYCFRKRQNAGMALGWGLLWFGATHAPDTGLLIPMNSLFLEHWMYLPSAGLFLGLAQSLHRLCPPRPVLRAAGGMASLGFTVLLSVMTYNQNAIWHDAASFYGNIFAHGVNSARAHNNMALYYSERKQYAQSVQEFQAAIAASDAYAETHYNLALIYLQIREDQAHADAAIAELNRALEIDPRFYRAYQTMGDIHEFVTHDQAKADAYHARARELLEQSR